MTLSDIQKLVEHGESSTREFKKSTAQLHRAFETLCGFLNGKGGIVLIGITDNGKIVGQEVSDSTQQTIAHEITRLEPSSMINIEYTSIEEGSPLKVICLKASASVIGTLKSPSKGRQKSPT